MRKQMPGGVNMLKVMITAEDGYQLSAVYARPVGESIGAIVLSSATGVKKEFYINFTRYLVQNGYTVLLYDYRGIGESAPNNLKTSASYMHEWGTKDMNAMLNYMVEERKHTDIIWVGHSVGAQLIGFLEKKQHIKKVIAINAAVGYWGYFPFPRNIAVCALWYVIGPLLIKMHGYGTMRRIGWGEDLPKNIILEWRQWCMNKNYFMKFLEQKIQADRFYHFTRPIIAVYTSDDFIANDKTVPLMMKFFPNAPLEIMKVPVEKHTRHKVGHIGIFRKKFERELWPLLVGVIEK